MRRIQKWAVISTITLLAIALGILIAPPARWAVKRLYLGSISRIPGHEFAPPKINMHSITVTSGTAQMVEIELPPDNPRIVILKSRREAILYSSEQELKRYKIALGGEPTGAKSKKGDKKTPEGRYLICNRLDRTQYHLFLGINYPNASDATRGLEAGLITEDQHREMTGAARTGRQPSWGTPLGGAIGLHGGGAGHDWTLGCIAFENEDIEEIWQASNYGTPVEIRP